MSPAPDPGLQENCFRTQREQFKRALVNKNFQVNSGCGTQPSTAIVPESASAQVAEDFGFETADSEHRCWGEHFQQVVLVKVRWCWSMILLRTLLQNSHRSHQFGFVAGLSAASCHRKSTAASGGEREVPAILFNISLEAVTTETDPAGGEIDTTSEGRL